MRSDGPGESARASAAGGFEVHLDVFEGPFDLLLALISKHKLDITQVALSSVTDEFISYIRALADRWDLDQASYFLVVAATLLDLKAARLLPSGEVDDEEDLALLEARDLLFARLLQYRAYKDAAAMLAGVHEAASVIEIRATGGHEVQDFHVLHQRCACQQRFHQGFGFGATWMDVHAHVGLNVLNRYLGRNRLALVFFLPGHKFSRAST